jgi:peptidoglycan-associated lipoprotein
MAGCSSGVKLDQPPVEDKTATSTAGANGANSGNTGQNGVAGVDLGQSDREGAGPVGVSRIVYFDFDSYSVKPEYQSVLDAHARYIKAVPGRKVMLEGHTDERGGREYNLALARRGRAPRAGPAGRARRPDGSRELRQGKARRAGQQRRRLRAEPPR